MLVAGWHKAYSKATIQRSEVGTRCVDARGRLPAREMGREKPGVFFLTVNTLST